MQQIGVVVLLGEALGATRSGNRGTREMLSGTDHMRSAVVLPAAPLHP